MSARRSIVVFGFLCFCLACSSSEDSDPPPTPTPTPTPTLTPTYTVGGTVSGLNGTLILRNNGVDDLTISADGAFTFAMPLATAATYAVTKVTTPSNQNCAVANGSGTISEANVSNVSITCANKAWTHPSSISDNISQDGQHASAPQVAMDNNGNAIITWYQSNGTHYQIFKSEYRSGSWTHPSSLSDNISPDGQIALLHQVAMDDNGNAIITWYQSDGTNDQIFKSEYRSGSWTHPSSLSDNISPDGEGAVDSQVAMDNNGNAIITWYQSDGTNSQIFKSEYRSGSWTHPSSLSDNISPDGQSAIDPQVVMDNNGNAIITWYESDGLKDQIFKSEYRSGSWTHPFNNSDNISRDLEHANAPQVAMDNNGNAIITWYQSNGFNNQIFKSEYR